MRLIYLSPLRESACEEGPLISEMSNAFLDHGLRTSELGAQLSLVFHLVHPSVTIPTANNGAQPSLFRDRLHRVVRSLLWHTRVEGPEFRSGLGSRHVAYRQAFSLADGKSRSVAARCSSSAVCPSPTFPAGREAAFRASMAARDQAGWLSYGCADRQRPRIAPDQDRARLDCKISGCHRRARWDTPARPAI